MSSKSCVVDPNPAILMKECYDTLLPVITDIVNMSFNTAIVPTAFKEAVVDPILKKESLDHEVRNSDLKLPFQSHRHKRL